MQNTFFHILGLFDFDINPNHFGQRTSVRDVVCWAFSPVGLFGQRTAARNVVYWASGPIGL